MKKGYVSALSMWWIIAVLSTHTVPSPNCWNLRSVSGASVLSFEPWHGSCHAKVS